MSVSWIDVVDTAIKIGLGSLITAISGYLVLNKTHNHELDKEKNIQRIKANDERKTKYVEFLSQSQALTQRYLSTSCTCQGDDYIEYLRIYNEVQVISGDIVRIGAYELLNSVNEFIIINKNGLERDLRKALRKRVDDSVGKFQVIAQQDIHIE